MQQVYCISKHMKTFRLCSHVFRVHNKTVLSICLFTHNSDFHNLQYQRILQKISVVPICLCTYLTYYMASHSKSVILMLHPMGTSNLRYWIWVFKSLAILLQALTLSACAIFLLLVQHLPNLSYLCIKVL